jgi:transcription termination/antitermination protein NusG
MMVDIASTEPRVSATKKWYVVHTYSGYEQKAKAALEERVRALKLEDKIGEIVVPVERVQELGKGGQRKVSSRKFFPGYIFVNMELDDETWHVIKNTPKVTGFVGHSAMPLAASRPALESIPEVPESEVTAIRQQMVRFRTLTGQWRKYGRKRARCACLSRFLAVPHRLSWTSCK